MDPSFKYFCGVFAIAFICLATIAAGPLSDSACEFDQQKLEGIHK